MNSAVIIPTNVLIVANKVKGVLYFIKRKAILVPLYDLLARPHFESSI